MTVPTSISRGGAIRNGSQTIYPYSFRVLSATDLVVTNTTPDGVDTVLALNVDYTVTGVGSANGGNIVMSNGGTSGHRLTWRRVLGIVQNTDLRNAGKFFAETHEDVFDRLVMIAQQLQEQMDRAAKLLAGVSGVSADLPVPTANLLLGWNSAATGLENKAGPISETLPALALSYLRRNAGNTSFESRTAQQVADELKLLMEGRVLLQSLSLTNVSSINADAAAIAGYDEIEIVCSIFPLVDGANINMRLSNNGGASYSAGASDYRWAAQLVNDTPAGAANGAISNAIGGAIAAGSAYAANGTIRCKRLSGFMQYAFSYISGAGQLLHLTGSGFFGAGTFNAVRLLASSGNITGAIKVYGLR